MAQHPTHIDVGFIGRAFSLVAAIALLPTQGRQDALFIAYGQFNVQFVEALESQLFKPFVVFVGWNVAVSGKDGVTWMVMVLIEPNKVVIAQINNMIRLSATVVVVGCRREQVAAQILPKLRGCRSHGAFHFVVNNALVYQICAWIIRLLKLQPMPFLSEV